MEISERLKILRKTLGLTQQEFAERIGIKRGTLATYEVGRNVPIDAVISLISLKFNVNETWLRTGNGEMFSALTREEEIATFLGEVLSQEGETFKKRYLSMLSQLDEQGWEALEKMMLFMENSKDRST